jgi:hypothetical protein
MVLELLDTPEPDFRQCWSCQFCVSRPATWMSSTTSDRSSGCRRSNWCGHERRHENEAGCGDCRVEWVIDWWAAFGVGLMIGSTAATLVTARLLVQAMEALLP